MNIKFKTNKTTATEKKKEYADEVFSRFDKFFDTDPSCNILLSKEGNVDEITVEASISVVGKPSYRASATDKSYHAAVDAVYEKLKKQIRRDKDKKAESQHKGLDKRPAIEEVEE